MEHSYDVIKLADGTKWFILSEIEYENSVYQLVIETNDNDDFFLETARILREYQKDGKIYSHVEKEEEKIKELLPLLMPEAETLLGNSKQLVKALEAQINS